MLPCGYWKWVLRPEIMASTRSLVRRGNLRLHWNHCNVSTFRIQETEMRSSRYKPGKIFSYFFNTNSNFNSNRCLENLLAREVQLDTRKIHMHLDSGEECFQPQREAISKPKWWKKWLLLSAPPAPQNALVPPCNYHCSY